MIRTIVSIHLFLKPSWEMDSDGWPRVSGQAAIYDLEFVWGGDSESAERRLIELGIDPDEVSIEELEEWD